MILPLQVDESVLSSENGDDLPPPPLSGSDDIPNRHPSFPWVQMALPGGGIVSVPLERASSGAGSTKARDDDVLSPTRQLVQPLQPTSSGMSGIPGSNSGGPGSIPVATSSATGSVGSVTQADLLTVAAGEPVTHFNLDQLLEIVQSFQLDTTMAGHDETTLRMARDLVLCADLVSNKTYPLLSQNDMTGALEQVGNRGTAPIPLVPAI